MSISYKIADRDSYDRIIQKIKALNREEFTEFSGFQMGSFLAVSYYEVYMTGIEAVWKQVIKNVIRCFVKDYSYNFESIQDNSVILFYSHEHARREDYKELIQNVNDMIPFATCFSGKDTKRKIIINRQSLHNMKLLRVWDKQLKSIEKNPVIRAFLVSKISLAYRWKELLCNNIEKIKKIKGLISIFDAREYENILTQVCNSIGIRSVTLEHGYFPAPFFEDADNNDFGMPYLGFVSTEFWTWGRVDKENGIKAGIEEKRMKAVGYPRRIKPISLRTDLFSVGIILDGGVRSKDTNMRMISIGISYAKLNCYKVIIKPHPHDSWDYIKDATSIEKDVVVEVNRESIDSFAKRVTFSICFNTSAYIDLLAMRARVFRYKDSTSINLFNFLEEDDCFKDIEDLNNLARSLSIDFNERNRVALLGDDIDASYQYSENARRIFWRE